jgi:hypothetical protein
MNESLNQFIETEEKTIDFFCLRVFMTSEASGYLIKSDRQSTMKSILWRLSIATVAKETKNSFPFYCFDLLAVVNITKPLLECCRWQGQTGFPFTATELQNN